MWRGIVVIGLLCFFLSCTTTDAGTPQQKPDTGKPITSSSASFEQATSVTASITNKDAQKAETLNPSENQTTQKTSPAMEIDSAVSGEDKSSAISFNLLAKEKVSYHNIFHPSPFVPRIIVKTETVKKKTSETSITQNASYSYTPTQSSSSSRSATTSTKTGYTPWMTENGDIYNRDNDGDGRVETVYVRGYYRKNGTYVRSHYRAKPRRR